MHTYKTFSLLAIAGSALAAPWGEGYYWGNHGGDDHRAMFTFTETATATAYTTVTGSPAAGNFFGYGPPAAATPSTTDVSTPTPVAATPDYFSYQPQVASTPAAAASSPTATADASSSGSQSGGQDDYMSVVSTWRAKLGLSALTQDSTLEANAMKTVTDDDGTMKHELNPGSMAQVLAPGNANNFESVFVGGWLCEIPSLPGLDGICTTMSAGWDYEGQTDHATILTNTAYSKIGCALNFGIWGCDLA